MTPSSVDDGGPTVPALLSMRQARSPSAIGQWVITPSGGFSPVTWSEYLASTQRLAHALRGLLVPGERVGIRARGSVRWDWANMAIMAARGVVVGMDPFGSKSQTADIFARADLTGLVVDDAKAVDRLDPAVVASLRFVVVLHGAACLPETAPQTDTKVIALDDLPAVHASSDWDESRPSDPALLLFTSGTTGAPKGIVYRHDQFRMAIDAIVETFSDIQEGSRLLSWLPLANIFQRTINICAVAGGAQTYYLEDPRDIVKQLSVISPDVLIGVPRFFEKQYEGIQKELARLPLPIRAAIRASMAVGHAHARSTRAQRAPHTLLRWMHQSADKLVLSRIREKVWGSRIRYAVSGSAPMPIALLESLHALGLPVFEGYAMSENMLPVAANRSSAFRFGTVGRAMPGNELKLGPDGELLLRGPGVCERYFGESTCLLDQDGFLPTGDYAEVDADGFLRLKGRKSEIFKTSTGRRVAPASVETLLKQLPYVDDASVYGAGRKSLVAVLSLSPGAPEGSTPPERLAEDLEQVTQSLPEYLRPKGFVLTRRPFTIEGGELTANLKLRRTAVERRYESWIEELYASMDDPHVPRPFARAAEPGLTELLTL